jgi:2'-5' RNA ligase
MVRAFIAIELSDEMRSQLGEQTAWLSARVPEGCIRWVKPAGIHLTLKFLGDITLDQVGEIGRSIERVASGRDPMVLRIAKFGAFPNPKRPRVLWIGVDEPTGSLLGAQRAVEVECEGLGFLREKRGFHPHLTLGRVRRDLPSSKLRQLAMALLELEIGELGRMPVDAIRLFKSDLRPSGAVYTCLLKADLKGSS